MILNGFRDTVLSKMPILRPASRQQVVEMYTGSKKRLYQRALDESRATPCNWLHSRLKGFSKFEKTDISKACRCINPRHPIYNLELARYLKPAEKIIYKYIGKVYGHPTVIKSYNALDSARVLREKWDMFTDPVAVGLDAKKFDMHVSIEALEYEHSWYTALFHSNRKLRRLLSRQLRNKGIAFTRDAIIKYVMEGTRSSGDINTSLGNCILMCALIYEYARQRGVKIALANNGDDCVVFMEREDLNCFMSGLQQWFANYGFRMVCETPVDEFECIEFCQTNPVYRGDAWIMMRNPRTCLIKDTMCTTSLNGKNSLRKWLRAVGMCGLALTSGLPMMQSFYSKYVDLGVAVSQSYIDHVHAGTSMVVRIAGLKCERRSITEEARFSFYKAFNILPDQQVLYENFFSEYSLDVQGDWDCITHDEKWMYTPLECEVGVADINCVHHGIT